MIWIVITWTYKCLFLCLIVFIALLGMHKAMVLLVITVGTVRCSMN
jgi:hypothetical protein